jgi:hypothetical protein
LFAHSLLSPTAVAVVLLLLLPNMLLATFMSSNSFYTGPVSIVTAGKQVASSTSQRMSSPAIVAGHFWLKRHWFNRGIPV